MISRLRVVGLAEGCTLLLLVGVAVPLKHLGGLPSATSVLGPVHGLAFLLYVATLVETAIAEGWPRRDWMRAALACLVPFGTFLNDAWLRRKQAAAGDGGLR